MYDEFLPLQSLVLAEGCEVIPGVPAAIAELRRRGLKIGSTTGYTRALMDYVIPAAAAGGYAPDVVVCVDEVTAGRPAPWMNFRAAELLGVYPMQAVLVVDDTPVGIEAGRQSGAFTLGVTQTGNALGLSEAEVRALPARELDRRLQDIEALFLAAGADAVIRSVADLPAWLSDQRPPANRVRSNR
jgi:phosphonoacetaldehyde hydrolase